MKIKTIILSLCIYFSNPLLAQAYYCPDIESIKAGDFKNWVPINRQLNRPATPEEITEFKTNIRFFDSADWSRYFQFGFGFCNYNSLRVGLASNDLPLFARPISSNWVWDNIIAHCDGENVEGCQF